MPIGLAVEVGIVGMGQAQDEEDVNQQIETDCRCGERPRKPRCTDCSF